MSLKDSEEIHERASVCNVRLENPEWPDLNRDSHTKKSHCSFFYNGGGGSGGPSETRTQPSRERSIVDVLRARPRSIVIYKGDKVSDNGNRLAFCLLLPWPFAHSTSAAG